MSRQSLAARASMALLLTIGFYLLALTIAGGLLFFVYAELRWADRILVRATILAVIGAGVILWSIVPRWDRFKAPGPRLEPSTHPELFKLLEEVARATKQELPLEVYLVGDVNAWVTQRGGMMGVGSRRVMGIGLPLMQAVTVSQLRAIVAHEFGHYYGGDTALGPWIYKTREAIRRTVENLGKSGSLLQKLFLGYGHLFMRVTQAISRAQELAADRLAAEVAGARDAIDALVEVQRAGAAYDVYWQSEVVPLLSNGFRPPIAAGLTQFLDDDRVSKSLREHIDKEMSSGEADPYDSHPPLRERIEELRKLDQGSSPRSTERASSLLGDLDGLEHDLLLSFGIDPSLVKGLANVAWEETGNRVYLPLWRKQVEQNAAALRDVRLTTLPDVAATLPAFAARLSIKDVAREEHAAVAASILGCALAVSLSNEGWSIDARPGSPVTLSKDGKSIQPFAVPSRLANGELSAQAWAEECAEAGVTDKSLA